MLKDQLKSLRNQHIDDCLSVSSGIVLKKTKGHKSLRLIFKAKTRMQHNQSTVGHAVTRSYKLCAT